MKNVGQAEQARIDRGNYYNDLHLASAPWRPLLFTHPDMPKPVWEMSMAVPYDPNRHSKNRGFLIGKNFATGKARIIRTDATSGGKDELAANIAQVLMDSGCRVVQGKIYVGILLQKLNWQADAHNLVDIIMDACQVATGVNDRWFVTSGVDWQMTKARPMFHLHMAQMVSDDSDTCSYCGLIHPLHQMKVTSKKRICVLCEKA